METTTFKYKGSPVTFSKGETATMVNATEMAKPFGKKPNDYLRLPSTKELIAAIARKSRISENQLVTTIVGSPENGGGTWMHEDIALDFAQWLSIDFKLWCNDRIKELLTTGTATMQMPSYPEALRQWAQAIEDRQRLESENKAQRETLEEQFPKVVFAEAVIGSKTSILMGELAKILTQNGYPIGQNRLFQWMREHEYLGSCGERYDIPNQRYVEAGYFEIKTNTFSVNGQMRTKATVKITGRGQEYFINKLLRSA